jgi:hypothetical protein
MTWRHYEKHFGYLCANLWLKGQFLSIRGLLLARSISHNKDVAGLCLSLAILDSQMLVESQLRGGMWLSASNIG